MYTAFLSESLKMARECKKHSESEDLEFGLDVMIAVFDDLVAYQTGRVPMGYAGRCRGCGHIVAAAVDQPNQLQITGEDIAEFIKAGYIVQFLPLSKINNELHKCTCKEMPDESA